MYSELCKFKNSSLLQVSGNSSIFLIADDHSNSGYSLVDGFDEYLPPNHPNVKISIYNPDLANCLSSECCLHPNAAFKFLSDSSYSFEINGNVSSFLIDLTLPNISPFLITN
jgi:hypothetical protein